MKIQGYNRIIGDLRKEGSYEEYYNYLLNYYGSDSNSSIFQELVYHHDQCQSGLNKEQFIEAAMSEDLYHKDLDKIYLIAEAERDYTDKPLFIALDRYFKVNPSIDDTKDTISARVKEIEEVKSM